MKGGIFICVLVSAAFGREKDTADLPVNIVKRAINQVDCDPDPCQNNGKCHDDDGVYCTCTCAYTGETCERLTCPIGKTGPNCAYNALKLTDCDPNPCQNNGECHDTRGCGLYCVCPSGFKGETCEKIECTTGYTGPDCAYQVITEIDCDPNPCQNDGVCHDTRGDGLYCVCPSGYTGAKCEAKECSSDYTGEGCDCGYYGDNCEYSGCYVHFGGTACDVSQGKVTENATVKVLRKNSVVASVCYCDSDCVSSIFNDCCFDSDCK